MLIDDFFKDFNQKKDKTIEQFGEFLKEENIQDANSHCPYIENIVESRYEYIKKEMINQKCDNLKGYNVIN